MKPSITALYDLIKFQNPSLTLTQSQLNFATPVRVTAEEYATYNKNTKVTVHAAADANASGTVDVFYNRLVLNFMLGGDPPWFYFGDAAVPVGTTYATMGDTLPYLNAHYGTTFVPSDVNANDVPDLENGSYLTIQPGNIAYDGQCWIDFPVTAPDPLSSVFPTTVIGEIYTGAYGLAQRAVNANGGNLYYAVLTESDNVVLDAATSAANGNAECSAVLTYTDIYNAYTGSVTVYYNRPSLVPSMAYGTTYLLPVGAVNSVDLLPVVNARTGLALTVNDIVNEPLPALVSGTASYTLQASPGAFHYKGSYALTLVDTLPVVSTLLTYNPDLADSAGAQPVTQRIWGVTVFTDNAYNWLRLTQPNSFDPATPFYTVEPAVVNDAATQTAHGGREAKVTLTFHDISGVTGTLDFYLNRYDLSALNSGAVYESLYLNLNAMIAAQYMFTRDMFSNAVSKAGGPNLGSSVLNPDIVDYHGLVFISNSGNLNVVYQAVPGSAIFRGQFETHVSDGDPGPNQI